MRLLIILVLTLSAVSKAAAISRYDAPSLRCDQIKTTLHHEGAAILRYPSKRTAGLTLYDRYVSGENFCGPHMITEATSVPAKDGSCRVLHCVDRPDRCDAFLNASGCR